MDNDDTLAAILIQLGRLYDLQVSLLAAFDADKAAQLVDFHANGGLFCPPPALAEQPEDAE